MHCGELHWLPIQQWINFKVAVTAYRCVNATAPEYPVKVFAPVASDEACQYLCSATQEESVISKTNTKTVGPSQQTCHPESALSLFYSTYPRDQ